MLFIKRLQTRELQVYKVVYPYGIVINLSKLLLYQNSRQVPKRSLSMIRSSSSQCSRIEIFVSTINVVCKSTARTCTRVCIMVIALYTRIIILCKRHCFTKTVLFRKGTVASNRHREIFPFFLSIHSVYTEVYAYTVSAQEEYKWL